MGSTSSNSSKARLLLKGPPSGRRRRARVLCGLAAKTRSSLLIAGALSMVAMLLWPVGAGSAQSPPVPEPVPDGRELLTPPCELGARGAAAAEAGTIKLVMCDDNLTIGVAATAADITFYPRFSPDRHSYVVHVADDVSEVVFKGLYNPRSEMEHSDVIQRPGWSFLAVDSDAAYMPSCPTCGRATAGNNGGDRSAAHVRLSAGVTTVELQPNHWFKRYGVSPSEVGGWDWLTSSDKIARKTYTLQLVWQSPDTPLAAPDEPAMAATVDYDTDDDGLIEVSSLAQLDAVRWDANGDGYSDHGGPLHEAFPDAMAAMGCPAAGCTGYELTADLDFDTNASGDADAGDDYWNGGHGWVPIGADAEHFSGTFEGNGHVVANLYINSTNDTQSQATGYARAEVVAAENQVPSLHLGLFEELASGGAIRNVTLEAVSVARDFSCRTYRKYRCADGFVGGLVGKSAGTISGSHVTGTVSNTITAGTNSRNAEQAVAGGLVGYALRSSVVTASSSAASVSAHHATASAVGSRVGGLAGINRGAIAAAYATGAVASNGDPAARLPGHFVGGLVGENSGSIAASYATGAASGGFERSGLVGRAVWPARVTDSYWDASASGTSLSAGGAGKSTVQLQAPTGYTGIYADWNVDLDADGNADDPWDFGACNQYAWLKSAGTRPATGQPAPVIATYSISAQASAAEGNAATLTITLSKTAPSGGVQFAVTTGFDGDSSATADDVGAIASPVTVSSGAMTASVTVPTKNDALTEGDETFTVTAESGTSCWVPSGDGKDTATVTITDDDIPGVTVTAASPVSISEGSSASYTVVLDTQPTESVTITATSSDTEAVSVSPASHIFTTDNWNMAATFTVTGESDDDTQDENVAVSHSITRAGAEYENVPVSTVRVEVTDTTTPPMQRSAIELPGPPTEMTLSSSTSGEVTVRWQAPTAGGDPVRYIVHLRPQHGGKGKTKTPKAKKTSVTYSGLTPGETYRVWVRARNEAGKGERVHATITLPE